MNALTDRQKISLELKGDHKIYYEDDTKDYQKSEILQGVRVNPTPFILSSTRS